MQSRLVQDGISCAVDRASSRNSGTVAKAKAMHS